MQRGIPPETRTFAEEAKVVFPVNRRLQSHDLIHLKLVVQFLK